MRKLPDAAALRGPLDVWEARDGGFSLHGFNTARTLAIASSVLLAVICSMAAVTIYDKFARSLIHRDAMITMALIQAISEYHGVDEATISARLTRQYPGFDREAANVAEFFKRVVHMPEVMRANIYAPEGVVVWSSSPELLGQWFAGNHDLEDALRGEVVAELSDREDKGKRGYRFFADSVTAFVEYYFPIWNKSRTKIIAVAEIYKNPESLLDTIRSGMAFIWGTALLAGGTIYAALLWVIWLARRIMQRQQEQLIESETVAVVGEMASVLAHGIRNPLTSIRTSAELALEERDEDVGREAVQDIVTETDRLERWVRELLQASAVQRADLRKLDIVQLLRDCLAQFSPVLERQNVSWDLEAGEAVPLICGDRPLLDSRQPVAGRRRGRGRRRHDGQLHRGDRGPGRPRW